MDGQRINVIEENGVSISVKPLHDKPTKCETFYNPHMHISRNFVIAALASYCNERTDVETIKCLDAFGATGISGLQWKHHLKSKVDVTINDVDEKAINSIKSQCILNKFETSLKWSGEENTLGIDQHSKINTVISESKPTVCDVKLSESEMNSDGKSLPTSNENCSRNITLSQADANVILHQHQFHFISLDPYGTTVQYLGAAFKNIYNGGLMVVTSTDLAALYGKQSQVTLRNYAGYTCKTDYYKEIAARLVLAAMARCASQCNKGFDVLYCVAVEHFVQVAVRIKRGAQYADKCASSIRQTIHCQHCEEHAFLPDSKAPLENPYGLLTCDCRSEHTGKTAVLLGPMWSESIFNVDFVAKMESQYQYLNLTKRFLVLIGQLKSEALCPANPSVTVLQAKNSDGEPDSKKPRKDESNCLWPAFYYDTHRRKIKEVHLPKLDKLVIMLQSEGYRASRTHFDNHSIRTSAKLHELIAVIKKNCKKCS